MRQIIPMSNEFAQEILSWHYIPPYDFYDLLFDQEDYSEWIQHMNQNDWIHEYAILENGTLVGYTTFEFDKDDLLFGIGLHPAYTGRGFGKEYMILCLDYAKTLYPYQDIQLSVAAFNERAIHLYESLGFNRSETFFQTINDHKYLFYRMKKKCDKGLRK